MSVYDYLQHFYLQVLEILEYAAVDKDNKERQIAVSDTMLKALKRWRKHLQLTVLPSPADQSPLLPRTKGSGPIKSATISLLNIRRLC